MLTAIRTLVIGLLLAALVCVAPFAWILRDGLGPDTTTSHGISAVWRFLMTFWIGPIVLGLSGLAILCHYMARRGQGGIAEPAGRLPAGDRCREEGNP